MEASDLKETLCSSNLGICFYVTLKYIHIE